MFRRPVGLCWRASPSHWQPASKTASLGSYRFDDEMAVPSLLSPSETQTAPLILGNAGNDVSGTDHGLLVAGDVIRLEELGYEGR